MGMIEEIAGLIHLVECVKIESIQTGCPHILEASLKAASICLNQGLCISNLTRCRGVIERKLDMLTKIPV